MEADPRYLDRLQCDTMKVSPPVYRGEPVPWREIAEWISKEDGEPITPEQVRRLTRRLLSHIMHQLIDDPELRDWAFENGIDLEDGDAHRILGGKHGHPNI
mgnify:CR=1 FL=1|jgi:hypothetical protein|tara:strand:+ start:187 stop:489 length:303 start_codon:yes stop_codon:yes gene_type:complete